MRLFFNYKTVQDYAVQIYQADTISKPKEVLDKRSEAILLLVAIDTGLMITDLLNLRHSDIKGDVLTANVNRLNKAVKYTLSSVTAKHLLNYKEWRKASNMGSHLVFNNVVTGKAYSRQWAYNRVDIANSSGSLGRYRKNVGASRILRATAARRVYDLTNDLDKAQAFLGIARKAAAKKILAL